MQQLRCDQLKRTVSFFILRKIRPRFGVSNCCGRENMVAPPYSALGPDANFGSGVHDDRQSDDDQCRKPGAVGIDDPDVRCADRFHWLNYTLAIDVLELAIEDCLQLQSCERQLHVFPNNCPGNSYHHNPHFRSVVPLARRFMPGLPETREIPLVCLIGACILLLSVPRSRRWSTIPPVLAFVAIASAVGCGGASG